MKSRLLIFSTLGLILCGLILASYGLLSLTLSRSILSIEDLDARQNLDRGFNAVQEDLNKLNYICRDWAEWDDTYAYIIDKNKKYSTGNLDYGSLDRLKLDKILYVDAKGRRIFGAETDAKHKRLILTPSALAPHFRLNTRLFKTIMAGKGVQGFLILPQGPLMLAARPILKSDGKGAIRGILVFGRYLDEENIGQLRGITHLQLNFSPFAKSKALDVGTKWIQPRNERWISGFAKIDDLYGKPQLILRVDLPRLIYRVGKESIHYFFLGLILVVIAFGICITWLIQKLYHYWQRHQQQSRELHEVITRARCLIWSAEVTQGTDPQNPFLWSLRLTDEEAAQQVIPLELSPGQTYTDAWFGCRHPDDLARMTEASENALREGQSYGVEYRCFDRDGQIHWIQEDVSITLLHPGVWKAVGVCTDISDRKSAELAVHESERRFRALVQNASDVIALLDPDGTMRYISPAAESVWGQPAEALVGRNLLQLVEVTDLARLTTLLEQAQSRENGSITAELGFQQENGAGRSCEVILNNLIGEPGVNGILLTCRDITLRKHFEAQLAHQAFHDSLTGLPNRALFMECLGHALARSARRMSQVAVLFLDLDGFKYINDSLGHEVGDQLLCQIAERLNRCIRSEDSIARLGGDEFVFLLEDLNDPSDALAVAERIAMELKDPLDLEGRRIFTTASIGIAYSGLGECRAEDLIKDADTAMYQAKGNGKAHYVVFDKDMNFQVLERMELEADIRHALEEKEFCLHYQPIIDLTTGTLTEVEALVRWNHPRLGLVSPMKFIPIAEENGLIVPLGLWVMEEACAAVRQWKRDYPHLSGLGLNVNLSARQLRQPDLKERVVQILQKTGLAPRDLKLEITESVAMQDIQATLEQLEAMKAAGVRLAVDDFGTGYSSMAYLSSLPVDNIKIDRSFIGKIGKGREDEAIIHAMVSLAKTLNIEITTEGIETGEQRDYLTALGCEKGQGFLFSRPLSEEAVQSLLAEKNPGSFLAEAGERTLAIHG